MSLSRSAFVVFEATKSFISFLGTNGGKNRQATPHRSIHNKHSEIAHISIHIRLFFVSDVGWPLVQMKTDQVQCSICETCDNHLRNFISCVLLHVGINCAKSLRALTCAQKKLFTWASRASNWSQIQGLVCRRAS